MEPAEKEKLVVEEATKEEQIPLSINRIVSRMYSGAPFADRPQGHSVRVYPPPPDHISEQYKD